jgi:hypothetical protein
LAGHEFYAYSYEYLKAGKTNLVDGILELRPGTTLYAADSYTDKYRIESWLGRFNYNYDEKYYFSASLRTDGSSRFHKDHRWGTFWSIGGNWRISKEAFMEDVKWIDNLSLKLSYGQQGNDNILNSDKTSNYYLWQSLMISGAVLVSFKTLFFTVDPIQLIFQTKSSVLIAVPLISNSKPEFLMSPTLAL